MVWQCGVYFRKFIEDGIFLCFAFRGIFRVEVYIMIRMFGPSWYIVHFANSYWCLGCLDFIWHASHCSLLTALCWLVNYQNWWSCTATEVLVQAFLALNLKCIKITMKKTIELYLGYSTTFHSAEVIRLDVRIETIIHRNMIGLGLSGAAKTINKTQLTTRRVTLISVHVLRPLTS